MQTKHLCVLIFNCTKGKVGAMKPIYPLQSNVLTVCSFVDHSCYFCLVFLMLSCASGYYCLVVTFWAMADLLALVCDVYCEFVTFLLLSWVRCGT